MVRRARTAAPRDTHIVFGHWAALGLLRRSDVTALDTGCVWGNHLTAVRLDRPARPVQVSAAAAARGKRSGDASA